MAFAPSCPSRLCSSLALGGSSRPSAQALRTLCFYKRDGMGEKIGQTLFIFLFISLGVGAGTLMVMVLPPRTPLMSAAETSTGSLQAGAIKPGTGPTGLPPTS